MVRLVVAVVSVFMPWPIKRWMLQTFMKYDLHPTARIHLSLILVKHLSMGPRSQIGNWNLCKGLERMVLKEATHIASRNLITGWPLGDNRFYGHISERMPSLVMEPHSAITNCHLIDGTAPITVGAFTTIAGYRSQILTHSIDVRLGRQDAKPVVIGQYCFLGTNCVILGGAKLPDYCVLGAQSLLNKPWEQTYHLYGGVPAKPLRELPRDAAYFTRVQGFVY